MSHQQSPRLLLALLTVLLAALCGEASAQTLPPYGSEFHEEFDLDEPGLTLQQAAAAVAVISGYAGPHTNMTDELVSCEPLPPGGVCVPGEILDVKMHLAYGIITSTPTVGYFDLCIEYSAVQTDCTVKRWRVCVEWVHVPYFWVYSFWVTLHTPPPPTSEPAPTGYRGSEVSVDGECITVRVIVWGGTVYTGAGFQAAASSGELSAAMAAIAAERDLDPTQTCFIWGAP